MTDDTALRASDAERSETAELLRSQHAEGRLDTDELEERIERCYAAKTRGELDALTIDLPHPERRLLPAPRRHRRPPRPLAFLAIAALVAVALTTDGEALWLLWPLAFFAFGAFRRGRGCWRMEYSRAVSSKRFP